MLTVVRVSTFEQLLCVLSVCYTDYLSPDSDLMGRVLPLSVLLVGT